MAQVFTDSVSVKLYKEEESESWLRDVPGVPGLKWSLSVVPVMKDGVVDHIGAYVRVVGGRATVSGTFHTVDHDVKERHYAGITKQFKFVFAGGEKHGIDYLICGNRKMNVEVTCYATFTLPSVDALASAVVHELTDPSARGCVVTVTRSKQNEIKMPRVFTDSVSVDFSEHNGDVESKLRDVPGAPEIKWSLLVVADNDADYENIGAYVRIVGGPVTVSGVFHASDTDFDDYDRDYNDDSDCTTETFKYDFVNGEKQGNKELCYSHEDRVLRVTCYATFTLPPAKALAPAMVHEYLNSSNPNSFDAVIKVGREDINVHRGFLSMISPAFKVMFGPDTEETKTGVIKITDFTPETVKNALEFCYGYNVEHKTTLEITDMIRFYNKFNIQPPIKKLTAWLKEKSSVQVANPVKK